MRGPSVSATNGPTMNKTVGTFYGKGGTNYGDYRRSGGPLVSTTDGPGEPLIGETVHSMTGLGSL